MRKYFEPDGRWELFKITSKEQFEHQFVIKGYFHNQVPKDVIEGFTIVEFLQAHSYYHWPMYDEAYNKALRVLEMAIKLKAKQLEIQLERISKTDRKYKISLSTIINEICNKPYLSKLKQDLNRARNLRNSQMHPESNSYSGAILSNGKNIKFIINVLNELFRDEEWLESQYTSHLQFDNTIKSYNNSLLVIQNNESAKLFYGILAYRFKNNMLYLVLNPVIKNLKQALKEHLEIKPYAISLSSFMFIDNAIFGRLFEGNDVKIYKTAEPEHMNYLKNQINDLNSLDKIEKAIFKSSLLNTTQWNLVELEYYDLTKNQA